MEDFDYTIQNENEINLLYDFHFKENPNDEATCIGVLKLPFHNESMLYISDISCVVEIATNEGKRKPHFHIYNMHKSFACSIRVDVAKYYIHNEYTDTLTPEQVEVFIKFISDKMPSTVDVTRWNFAKTSLCYQFNRWWSLSRKKQPKYKELLNERRRYKWES